MQPGRNGQRTQTVRHVRIARSVWQESVLCEAKVRQVTVQSVHTVPVARQASVQSARQARNVCIVPGARQQGIVRIVRTVLGVRQQGIARSVRTVREARLAIVRTVLGVRQQGIVPYARIDLRDRTETVKTVLAVTEETEMKMKEITAGISRITVRAAHVAKLIKTVRESAAVVRRNRGIGLSRKSAK